MRSNEVKGAISRRHTLPRAPSHLLVLPLFPRVTFTCANSRASFPRASCLAPHSLTPHPPRLAPQRRCSATSLRATLMPQDPPLAPRPSRLLPFASCLLPRASRLIPSRLIPPRLSPHPPSRLSPLASCLVSPSTSTRYRFSQRRNAQRRLRARRVDQRQGTPDNKRTGRCAEHCQPRLES